MTLQYHVQQKMAAKRDPEVESKALNWVAAVSGRTVPEGYSYVEALKDGTMLCDMMNKLSPGIIPKIHTQGADFKMIENINSFCKACKQYGVPVAHVFATVDLWEAKDVQRVTDTIYTLGKTVHEHPEFKGPHLVEKPASN